MTRRRAVRRDVAVTLLYVRSLRAPKPRFITTRRGFGLTHVRWGLTNPALAISTLRHGSLEGFPGSYYPALSAGSLTLIARFLPGFHLRNFGHAVLAAGVYGVLQTVLSGILSVIAFIPIMLTFGLFIFVINAFILFITDKLLEGFQIENLTTTLVVQSV